MIQICPFCDEPTLYETEACRILDCDGEPRPVHLECLMRSVMGSVGHQRGECSCKGVDDTSEEGLTYRQAAKAALEYYRAWNAAPPVEVEAH
jgi:hypothetical protein